MGFLMLVLLILQWLMPKLVDPTVPFGVRVPPYRLRDPAVLLAHRRYTVGMSMTLVFCVATWLWIWLGDPNSINSVSYIALLPLIPLVLGFFNYYAVHRGLRQAKVEGRWMDGHRQVIVAETNPTIFQATVSWVWSLPALLVIIATVVLGAVRYPKVPRVFPIHFDANGVANGFATKSVNSVFAPVFFQVGILILMVILHVILGRTRGNLDPADPAGSALRQGRRKVRLIQATWVLMAGINVSLLWGSIVIWGVIHVSSAAVMWGTMIPLVICIVILTSVFIRSPLSTFSSNEPTVAHGNEAGIPVRRDDDASWYLGAIYFNRDDPRFVVDKRFGVGWTLNFAHPLSRVIIGAIILIVVGSTVILPIVAHTSEY